jgi:hypothetical protein
LLTEVSVSHSHTVKVTGFFFHDDPKAVALLLYLLCLLSYLDPVVKVPQISLASETTKNR